ncbi:polysaccharide lyase family 7 protein [Roseivirga sp.]|uniref:polysaccharide lyase family 7 protein n=1 Tax=Roseivirga sp. TaxID=1964215 RepID=UPI003B8BD242
MNRALVSIAILVLSVNGYSQEIDLSHWKITIPTGKPTEVSPPEIFDYATNEELKPFFFKDSTDGALVFYAYPAASTRNSSYSRTELREQLEPGSNSVNWTFVEGGTMRGTLSVPKISRSSNGNYHRVIVMQIHGRLTNEQKALIGADDNNAPPMLKIYWDEGKVRVKTKVLKNKKASDTDILHEDAWTDDPGRKFKEIVGYNKFTLEVKVSEGKMEVTLNDKETFVYDSEDISRWGVLENYFKAGNYFQSKERGAYAIVKYYELEVKH